MELWGDLGDPPSMNPSTPWTGRERSWSAWKLRRCHGLKEANPEGLGASRRGGLPLTEHTH